MQILFLAYKILQLLVQRATAFLSLHMKCSQAYKRTI